MLGGMRGNIVAVLIELYNFYLRYDAPDACTEVPLVMSVIVMCILLFSGWKGWGIFYRHHVAVSGTTDRQ
jgi:uncharacterized membrane protein